MQGLWETEDGHPTHWWIIRLPKEVASSQSPEGCSLAGWKEERAFPTEGTVYSTVYAKDQGERTVVRTCMGLTVCYWGEREVSNMAAK